MIWMNYRLLGREFFVSYMVVYLEGASGPSKMGEEAEPMVINGATGMSYWYLVHTLHYNPYI